MYCVEKVKFHSADRHLPLRCTPSLRVSCISSVDLGSIGRMQEL